MNDSMTLRLVRSSLALAAIAALVFTFAAAPAQAQDGEGEEMTIAQLIESNLEARGGKDKLDNLETARITGTMTMGGGQMTAPFTWEWKAPNKLRMEFTFQGMTGIQAYNGETGWQVMPFMGKTEPEKMSEEDAATLEEQADFRGPFYNPEDRGYTLEFMGTAEVEGTPTYKVKVTQKDGDESYLYLDQEYFLEIKSESKSEIQGQEVAVSSAIGDYKPVGGILIPHSMDQTMEGAPAGQGQTITFETVELNVELPDEHFQMPETSDEGSGEESGR